ncbi:MAG: hypothetical protein IT373_04975 [Polyangiaceae bacterium]|nr:hypothetical protein [Polyangiaceae bacterium]
MSLRKILYLGALVATAGALGAAAACKSGDAEGTGAAAGNGTGASHVGGAGGSHQGGTGQGGFIFTGTGGEAGYQGAGGGCASESVKAEKQPLDMYVMFDQSGSMTDPVAGGGDKWGAVTSAFGAFVQQPAALGIGIGLQYFPLVTTAQCPASCQSNADCAGCGSCFVVNGTGTCSGVDSCSTVDYATPEVPIQTLPAVRADVLTSLLGHVPVGATPTSAALAGAVSYATSWASAHLDHVTIVVLATDGDPTECDTNLANINAIAAGAAAGTPRVLTFVIGVGTSLSALNGIAAAGGTTAAFLVDTSQDVGEQFLNALNQIQGQALGCVYQIPQPQQGTIDYTKVNVEYTPGLGGGTQPFPKVSGPADCPPNGDAWYYDDNQSPQQILLCDATCNKVKADAGGEIDIVLGCTTIVP